MLLLQQFRSVHVTCGPFSCGVKNKRGFMECIVIKTLMRKSKLCTAVAVVVIVGFI